MKHWLWRAVDQTGVVLDVLVQRRRDKQAAKEPVELSHFVSVGKNLTVALCSGTSLVGVFMSHLPRVLSERRCLIVEGGATLRGTRILHRSALLPLSEDGVSISHVLGAASYRALAAEEAWEAGVTETQWV